MADIYEFSERLIDLGERLSNVADAAAGKRPARGSRAGGAAGWILLPAAGAALYAAARSRFFARQAKAVLDEAKERSATMSRATDLSGDLLSSVRQKSTSETPKRRSQSQPRRRKASTAASGASARRKSPRRSTKS
jgi:hypothetical protein